MSKQVKLVAKKIKEAKDPLILAGNGIRLAGAHKELLKIFCIIDIKCVTGMFTADDIAPLHSLGPQGMWGKKEANQAIDNCDLLLVIGDRLDLTQTSYDYKNFATQAFKIQVDIDPAVLAKKTTKIDLPICMDAKEFLDELYRRL